MVPYTRGHERMRPSAEILAEVRDAAARGHREIQLLGQIVNHYQAPDDAACDFAGLLERVHEVPGVERIRFASPHPRHVTPRLLEAYRSLPRVCRHLHLPVQSGSTRVLAAMRRRYSRERYLEILQEVREAVPDICLSTDMIVGFPGETAADFDDTLSLTAQARFHSMFSFKYSPRPRTLAIKRMPDDVAEDEKTRRIVELQALQREIQSDLHRQSVGTVEQVLIDATSRRRDHELSGRTSGNVVVNFPGRALLARTTGAGAHHRGRPEQRARRGDGSGGVMPVRMLIKGLMMDPVTNMPILVLRDEAGERTLPIWIGMFEAHAVALQLENSGSPRPMTHDLLKHMIEALGGTVTEVHITDVRDGTFYALVYLEREWRPGRRRFAPL